MSPLSARRLADKIQAWNPSFTSIGKSIQDNLPHSSEEVKQKLRSWNESLGKHFRKHDSYSGNHDGPPYTAGDQKTRASLGLFATHSPVAENAKIAKEFRGSEKLERSDLRFTSYHTECRAHGSISESRIPTSTIGVGTSSSQSGVDLGGNTKRPSINVRSSLSIPLRSIPVSGLSHDSSRVSKMNRTLRDKERTYEFKFGETPTHSPHAVTPVLRHSASASDLADHLIDSVKKFRRSISNVSLRKKFARSESDEEAALHVPISFPMHSAPPPPIRQNSIQRSYTSLDFQHPDQEPHSRKPLLESIAENGESQHPRNGLVQQDLIFALHESRVCLPQPPTTSANRLPYSHTSTLGRRSGSFSGLERPEPEPPRISSQQSDRSSTISVQLIEQIGWISDMAALRVSINSTRALQRAPPLEIYQALCAEAKIVATTYEMMHGAGGSTWWTEMQLQENPATLELVGPPGVGGRVTGKIIADGEYSRHTHNSHARFPPRNHGACHCHNYKVWEAVTDMRWRAIGLSRTDDEERWVVVLSE